MTFTKGSNIKKALKQYSRINCIAHVLNLILTHTFKNPVSSILQLCLHCKSLVEYLKRSGNCQKLDTTVKQECISRWNTKFDMLVSIRKNFDRIEKTLESTKEEYRLHAIEKYLLDRLILFLHPFKTATLLFEAEKKPTIHLVLLHMHILKEKLIKLQSEETTIEVQALIRHCLDNIFDVKFQPHRVHKIAAFLWPEYKQLRFLEDNSREEIHTLVKDELHCILANRESSTPTLSCSSGCPRVELHTNTSDCSDAEDDVQFCNKYKDIYTDSDNNWQSKVNVEMELYKGSRATDRNILQWWRSHEKDFPLLNQLGREILCIPASNASCERAFSSAKRVLEDRRSNLKGENIDAVLFLHSAGRD